MNLIPIKIPMKVSVSDMTIPMSVSVAIINSGNVTVKKLTVTENGTYHEEELAYSPVIVSVPNTYTVSDEGKVVSGGALVDQTSRNVTENGTVDTTLNDEVVVNVQPPLEAKTTTPTKQTQVIEPTSPNYGLSRVTVEPIPSQYIVPSGALTITENGVYDVTEKVSADVNVKQWDTELTEILDGTATELSNLPSGLSKIKPYAFYSEGKSRLPSGYKELEYAQSTGTQYVLSNMTFSNNTPYKIVIDMQGTSTNDSVGIGWNAGGGVYFRDDKYSNGLQAGVTPYSSDKRLIVTIEIGANGTSTYTYADTDGTVLETQTRSNTSLSSWAQVNFPLFAITMSASSSPQWGYYKGRIYSFKAYKNGVLTCNFVPASRNGVVGFYNLVNDIFYTRSGSGNLVGGDVIPVQPADYSIETADLNVTEIGEYAFYSNALSSLTLRANQVVTLGNRALEGTGIANGTGTVYVPSDLVSAYEADDSWSMYNIEAII